MSSLHQFVVVPCAQITDQCLFVGWYGSMPAGREHDTRMRCVRTSGGAAPWQISGPRVAYIVSVVSLSTLSRVVRGGGWVGLGVGGSPSARAVPRDYD
eukprot:788409-Prymnesium_polylepis.1